MGIEFLTEKVTYGGMSMQYDHVGNASYVTVRLGGSVVRTIEITSEVMVDLDSDGRPVGVEVLRRADISDLVSVLRRCRVDLMSDETTPDSA